MARQGSTLALLSDVADSLGRLVRGELRLARAEATEGLTAARGGLVRLALAAMFGLVGLTVLAGAAVAGLVAAGLALAWAALAVGLGLCLVAAGLALAGRAALRMRRLWPDRALRGLRRDARVLRGARAGMSDV